MAVATAQQSRLQPFEIGTDLRAEALASQSFATGGGKLSFKFNNSGLLAWARIQLTGTMTSATGSTYAALGPWNLINRVRLVTNMQNIVPIDLSGYELYLINCAMQLGWAPDVPTDTRLFAAALSTAGSAWTLIWDVPISLNLGPQRRYGVLPLQDPTVQARLEITPGQITDAITGSGTSFASGTVQVTQYNWEVPNQQKYELPVGPGRQTIHYLLSKPFNLGSTGAQQLILNRDDARLLRIFFYALVNGARDPVNWTSFSLKYDVTNIPQTLQNYDLLVQMRRNTGLDWTGVGGTTAAPQRGGAFLFDRWHASHLQGAGKFWDSLYIPSINQIEFDPTLRSGTTIASGDQMFLVTDELQQL
jgi:hypothetical protein